MTSTPDPSPALPDEAARTAARLVYGEDPQGYEAGRPKYPDEVFDVLATRCGLRPGAAVLEIGPGTGRATQRLVGAGARVLAIEPDPALARHLIAEVGGSPITVVESTFEAADVPDASFDLAVAAMSFHWVDQAIGLPKLGQVLRTGGWAALWWTVFGDPSRPDLFRDATRHLLDAPGTGGPPPERVPFELDVAGWRHALTTWAGLADVDSVLIPWTARFDVDAVRALHASTIAVRRRPPDEQRVLLDRLATIARDEFGGVVERPFVTALHVGRRP